MENGIKEYAVVWEDLGIENDFLFGKVMQDPELCKELLQRILPELQIDHIEYPELQKSIRPDADAKSVRLDVYVKDEKGTIYDIEMQVTDTKELPKRTRYYQSMIDLQMIDKGQLYSKLKPSYIIFISPFDAFGKGRHIYTFENLCKEDKNISLNDGTIKIFLNAAGKMDDTGKELRAFLDYVAGKKSEDTFVKKLEEAVKQAKKNRKWRHEYMTLLMRDQENIEKGIKEGIEKGIEKGTQRERERGIRLMIESGKELGVSRDSMQAKVAEKYNLDDSVAMEYMNRYWAI